jgi:hypothetical protein
MEHTHSCEETAAHARCFGDDELMDSALPSLSELAFDFEGPEMHLHCCESVPATPRREARRPDKPALQTSPTTSTDMKAFLGFCLNA